MLTQTESEYIKGLISSYEAKGYHSYLCHTVTERNNDFDICIYFSKTDIIARDNSIYSLKDTVKIYIDSSSRSYGSGGYIDTPRVMIADSNFSGTISINVAEFVYTNALVSYDEAVYMINPDLMQASATNYSNRVSFSVILCILVVLILNTFLFKILRLK